MVEQTQRKWLALALLATVQFMVVLDIAIVNVALPSIQTDLGFSQENLQWVISAYALFFGGFLLLGGRAADLIGRRRLFIIGTIVFSASSLLSGFAWSDESLIIARAIQGLGAAIITPAALSILMTTFSEGRERNAALGVWGAVGAFGAVAGVLLGGILTDRVQLGVDLLHQRPGRARRAGADAAAAHREPRRARQDVRRARGRARDGRAGHARLRDHPGQRVRLDLGGDDRALRRRRSAPRGASSAGSSAPRSRWCRSRSSGSRR